jgi:hypothetical protein
MAQIVPSLRTDELRDAELHVAREDIKMLHALQNLLFAAGDMGDDGNPIRALSMDGTAGAKVREAALAFQTAAHLALDAPCRPADLEEARTTGFGSHASLGTKEIRHARDHQPGRHWR